jgi:hypothetical protein
VVPVRFDVDGEIHELPDDNATTLGAQLRRSAATRLAEQGSKEARDVAALIEAALAGRHDKPIKLNHQAAEVVFHCLDESPATLVYDPDFGPITRLYRAVLAMQREHRQHG